jgi:hypothetical protein
MNFPIQEYKFIPFLSNKNLFQKLRGRKAVLDKNQSNQSLPQI